MAFGSPGPLPLRLCVCVGVVLGIFNDRLEHDHFRGIPPGRPHPPSDRKPVDDFFEELGLARPNCESSCDCSLRAGCTCKIVFWRDQRFIDSIHLKRCNLTGRRIHSNSTVLQLKFLQSLSIRGSGLEGSVPTGFSTVAELDLFGNELTGDISVLKDLPRGLKRIVLSSNRLVGTIPEHLPFNHLKELRLANNALTGGIPAKLFAAARLEILSLANNKLSGAIPDISSPVGPLGELYLEGNQLLGEIPSSIAKLNELRVLRLEHNALEGKIPEELSSLLSLKQLRLNGNKLRGPIPEGLGKLRNLTVLQLNDLALDCPIPESLGSLTELIVLDLSNSNLKGAIPAQFAQLTKMESLSLMNNDLWGRLPPLNMPELRVALLGRNHFSGPLPTAFCEMQQLLSLSLHWNNLNGALPHCLGHVTNLTDLFLAHNEFDGEVPTSFSNLDQLEVITLHSNHFGGTIPELTQSSLTIATFHDNDFAGNIPAFNLSASCSNSPWYRLHGMDCLMLEAAMEREDVRDCGELQSIFKIEISGLLQQCPKTCNTCNVNGLQAKATLHGNRLAGSIPRSINSSRIQTTALMGNLLGDGEPLDANWLPPEDPRLCWDGVDVFCCCFV
ncbi:unnamed protein product [Symbiodinium necroappetens]|uniref:Disease resistance R13L4/SHOC-2-like LRR domain-containing protein n=1 Tax=Symbiodinium necroappetens TaxID=1628268 RepID=A0A812MM49_9DINO|nr:unnamed protein product [Symbiodinium necroappetens]